MKKDTTGAYGAKYFANGILKGGRNVKAFVKK